MNWKLLLLPLLGLILSCTAANTETEITETEISEIKVEELCFQNIYPFKDEPEFKDVVELYLEIKEDSVYGVYDYLPAFKDQRRGSFFGVMKENTAIVDYNFMQEGEESTVLMVITFTDGIAEVKGGEPGLGLAESLKLVSCDEMLSSWD